MVEKKAGKIPVNARITIDYSKKKPNVKFGYPRKDAAKQNEGGILFAASLIIMVTLTFLFIYFIFLPDIHTDQEPTDCIFEEYSKPQYGEINYYVNVSCNNGFAQRITYWRGSNYIDRNPNIINYIFSMMDFSPSFGESLPYPISIKLLGLFTLVAGLLCWFGLVFLLNKFLTKICVKWGWFKRKIPNINKVIYGKGYYKKFIKCPSNKIIELPLFNNIHLDYHAKGDFSKYLKLFEIKDHPFQYGKFKDFRKKKKKGKKNIMLWRARFYFTEIPKKGSLEIFFT